MPTAIFVNLPVQDLQRSKDFWTALGYTFNARFTDENAASLVIDEDHIYAMLLVHDFFKTFTKKNIADSSTVEAIIALSADSQGEVDTLVDNALANGGSIAGEPQDFGYMYSRSFLDPDGHQWEVVFMDLSQAPAPASADAQ